MSDVRSSEGTEDPAIPEEISSVGGPEPEPPDDATRDDDSGGGSSRRWFLLGLLAVAAALGILALDLEIIIDRVTRWGNGTDHEPVAVEADSVLEMTESMREVLLFFPRGGGAPLGAEAGRIFDLRTSTAQGKLIVERLAAGPQSEDLAVALPSDTHLREMWISPGGTAYVDFSRQLGSNHPGGTTAEIQTVYSVVNSLVYNLPDVRRVQILIEGREIDTLSGHLALWLPLSADLSIVETGGSDAPPPSTARIETPPPSLARKTP